MSYCLRGERDRDLECDLERLLLLLFLPIFTSFLKLEDKRASATHSGAPAGVQLSEALTRCADSCRSACVCQAPSLPLWQWGGWETSLLL